MKSRRWFLDDEEWIYRDNVPTITVIEDDDAEDTGLLDKHGNPIYRVRERGKLGF